MTVQNSVSFRGIVFRSLILAMASTIALSAWLLWPEWQRYSALRRLEEAGRARDAERFLEAVEAIGKLPADERLVSDLVERVKDRDPGVRAYSILTLAVLQPRPVSVVPLLIATIDDPDEDDSVRAAAAAACRPFGENASDAIPSLVKATQFADAKSDLWFAAMDTVSDLATEVPLSGIGNVRWVPEEPPTPDSSAREYAEFLVRIANGGF